MQNPYMRPCITFCKVGVGLRSRVPLEAPRPAKGRQELGKFVDKALGLVVQTKTGSNGLELQKDAKITKIEVTEVIETY